MTKNIHPLALAFLEAFKSMHDNEYGTTATEAYRDVRNAWQNAGCPICETAHELADTYASIQSALPNDINGSEP